MERTSAAAVTCNVCNKPNLRQDQQLYWTRERRYVELERMLKALVVVVVGMIAWLLLSPDGSKHGYAGVGYSAGFPIALGFVLWDTTSLVTRKRSILRLEVVWPALVFTLGFAPLLIWLVVLLLTGPARFFTEASLGTITVIGVWTLAWFVLARLMSRLVNRIGRLRGNYLTRRMG